MPAFFMSRYPNATLLLLRVVAGAMLMQHGAQKLFGALDGHVAERFTRNWFAGVIECVLPPLLIAGAGTRVVAFILSGELAFAYFMVHAPNGFWPVQNRGELAVLYSFVFFHVSAVGAGRYSVDAALARRRAPAPAPGLARA